MILFQKYQ